MFIQHPSTTKFHYYRFAHRSVHKTADWHSLLQTDALQESQSIDGHGWDAVEDDVENCIYYLPKAKLTLASSIDPPLNSLLKNQWWKNHLVSSLLIHFALISFCLIYSLMILKGTRYPDYGHFSNLLIYTKVNLCTTSLWEIWASAKCRTTPKTEREEEQPTASTRLPGRETALLGNDKTNLRSDSLWHL